MTSRVTPNSSRPNSSRKKEDLIAKRLLYALFNGAIDAVQKGVSSVEELDTGLKEVLWMDQGPFAMMKKIGREKVQENFDYLLNNVGKRFTQTALSL
jgi:3-hydroxyacyl-CoA dehydrogenase